MKKTVSLLLVLIIVFSTTASVFCTDTNNSTDLLGYTYTEYITIDSIEYRYDYEYSDSFRKTTISCEDVVIAVIENNTSKGCIKLNGEIISQTQSNRQMVPDPPIPGNDTSWIYLNYYSDSVTWPKNTLASVFAGLLANIARIYSSQVIACLGSIIQTMAKNGGSASVACYSYWNGVNANPIIYKYHWHANINGSSYGWYDSYISVC